MMRLVLASKSKARAAMLAQAGITVDLMPADIDERALDALLAGKGAAPDAIAVELAEAKALAVSQKAPGRAVIGADQTLALGSQRFSKPANLAQARVHLQAFRGRIHHLHSGVALAQDGEVLFSAVSSAAMHVRDFSDAFIDSYLDAIGDQALTSVGCYQFEGLGIQLFDRIEGDYFTILGMPLLDLLGALRRHGLAQT
ncbi:MAG: Maf family protein [Alphaproteobacteria bacterium]|jgi:septum formation protein